jgi:hypothetical protein
VSLDIPPPGSEDVRRAHEQANNAKEKLPLRTILLIILVLLLLGALPTWPYSSGWGYYPSGGLVIVIIVILLLARGK